MYALARLGLWAFAMLVCAAAPAMAQFIQQCPKLVGSGYTGGPQQGWSVALSADGNTMIVGGYLDNSFIGAAWVFVRSNGAWTQQGPKLVGSGYSGTARQGASVALSADGNTAIVGGPEDNGGIGATWVWTRTGSTWTQQGLKLIGSGQVDGASFGGSVALSADGNTAIIGGEQDAANKGAAWVFTRSGGVWSQQGNKISSPYSVGHFGASGAMSADGTIALIGAPLVDSEVGAAWIFTQSGGVWTLGPMLVGSGYSGQSMQGTSVALSADGTTAIVGGPGDSGIGAAWFFAQSGGVWSQQGAKLTGAGEVGAGLFGASVAVSGDNTTAMVGGPNDNPHVNTGATGAAWVFNQNGGVWTQQGPKLVGNGYSYSGVSEQGMSVALSSNGTVAIVGGPNDGDGIGAVWVFGPGLQISPNTHDFNGDRVSDILWRDSSSGELAMWLMNGGQRAGQIFSEANIEQVASVWSVVGTRDFNGDGNSDILWLDTGGDLGVWLMSGSAVASTIGLGNIGTQWSVAGTGDFNGDGTGDILWRNVSTGELAIWLMSNGQYSSGVDFGVVPLVWQVVGTGDFNGDGTSDVLWYNTQTGDVAIWLMNSGQFSSGVALGNVGTQWSVVGTGDFDGDGTSDILWHDTSGDLAIWLMSNGQFSSGATLGQVATTWSVAETGDFDGDGKSDILWIDTSGDLGIWFMNGLTVSSTIGLGNVGTTLQVQGKNAD